MIKAEILWDIYLRICVAPKGENLKLNASKKKVGYKKKNQQCTRKISDFFRSSKEDVDFDSPSKTMNIVFYFI